MAKQCEKCGSSGKWNPALGGYDMLDYCAECSADLCDECMAKGHCGHVPAISGTEADYGDDTAAEPATTSPT